MAHSKARQGVSRIVRNVIIPLEKAIEECFADARRPFMTLYLSLFRMIPPSLCNAMDFLFLRMLSGFFYRSFDSKWSTNIMPCTNLGVLWVVYSLN